jgi:3-oxoacyl-[acyl-carrier protein] reductase
MIQNNDLSQEMMNSKLKQPLRGKVALVTGTSKSIGRAIAERLSRDGASVIVHYRSHEQEAQEVASVLHAQGTLCL